MSENENVVSFRPTKRLLVEIITKDINVHDSILDLIDNSVDSYARHKIKDRRKIEIEMTNKSLIIEDNCGGIDRDTLVNHVFRSGELPGFVAQTIGYYGIGLKRALFKLANEFVFETYDGKDYSKIFMNVPEWEKKDDDDWDIPLDFKDNISLKGKKPFTKITISKYKEEISRILTTIFINKFKNDLSIYYTRFIEKEIQFVFNNEQIEAFDLEATYSPEIKPIFIKESYDNVKYKIYCWVEKKTDSRSRAVKIQEKNGWNIFMNKRLIMINDKSLVTGWSGQKYELPNYHNIYNDFRGIVMIESSDPGLLPINTTKNNFNLEHPFYHYIKQKMVETARPIITYLSNKYNRDKIDNVDREIDQEIKKDKDDEKKLETKFIDDLKPQAKFNPPKLKKKTDLIPISYKRPLKQIEKIKQTYHLKSNKGVGEYTFDYFWNFEGLKDE
ncbi:MAG: ATP-binding protein [Ignavibacteriales bacterium]|nr:ATP-binding protein [Ignavibacteriales bacterium]